MRVTLLGLIDGARCPIQIDIGFGDAVTSGPEDVKYPIMLVEFEASFGLKEAFAQDRYKQIQWKAFLRKNQLEALTLNSIVEALEIFLQPIYKAIRGNSEFHANWQALLGYKHQWRIL